MNTSPAISPASSTTRQFDLIVVGAGSGGFGAALAAARLGCEVLLIEKGDSLGGNAARGGVNNWEPGVGGTGIPFELYKRLKRIPNAVGIYSFKRSRPDEVPFPGSEQVIDPTKRYVDSLRRFGAPVEREAETRFRQEHWHGVPYEPEPYAAEMEKMLAETGRCTVWKNTAMAEARVDGRRIASLTLADGRSVSAPYFVDGTADVLLAQLCGCETRLGQDARSCYGEPGAPEKPNNLLNGTTLIYRVSPKATAAVDPLPDGVPADCWWAPKFPRAFCTQYPNGDYNINSTPTMAGQETARLGYVAAYAECKRRIYAHWHNFQKIYPDFQRFRMSWIAPALGVREGPRIVGLYVLTEHDLTAGLSGQNHNDIIAIADHSKDTHGEDTGRGWHNATTPRAAHVHYKEMREPYGVPFRCLIPRELDNLAVACRGAGFTSIAASSCRLSRTMMQLGEAAGTAVALALPQRIDLASVSPDALRSQLKKQHVELEWPRSPALLSYLQNEDHLG